MYNKTLTLLAVLITITTPSVLSEPLENWSTTQPLPQPLLNPKSITINSTIYLIGGITKTGIPSQHIYTFNHSTQTWEDTASMQTTRTHFDLTTYKNKIYIIGGNACGCSGQPATSGIVEVYDTTQNKWETKTPMPTPRYGHTIHIYNEKIYAIGGFTHLHPPPALNTTEIYDIKNDTWHTGPPMPTRRGYTASTIQNHTLYIIGGSQTDQLITAPPLNIVEAFNLTTNEWSQKNPLPSPCYASQSFTINNTIFLMLGIPFNSTRNVLKYNPKNDSWSISKPMPTSRAYFAATNTTSNNIHTIGGYSPATYHTTHEIFTQKKNQKPAQVTIENIQYIDNQTLQLSGTTQTSNGTIEFVHIKIDDREWEKTHGTTLWTYQINLTTLQAGLHNITVQCFDGIHYSTPVYYEYTMNPQPTIATKPIPGFQTFTILFVVLLLILYFYYKKNIKKI